MKFYLIFILFVTCTLFCDAQIGVQLYSNIITGAQQTEAYLPRLKNKKVAIVTNASGIINNKHLVDTLIKLNVNIVKIFGPEHGFRGTADAGIKVKSCKDPITNITIVSLYGSHKKPTKEDLKGIDIVLYDIQDIGVRFYTYISTMTYVMEACAENKKELIIFDRPNPNGFYIDGSVMEDKYKSFLGLHKVPIVYGMTCGEYAQMVNGEFWLIDSLQCNLTIIPLKKYDRSKFVSGLPVKPSPNIPNDNAILAYPTLGLFEGTIISLGRGTDYPFQYIGSPYHSSDDYKFQFTPKSKPITKKPKYQDTVCYGFDLSNSEELFLKYPGINLTYINSFYNHIFESIQKKFFDKNFNYHSGNSDLQQQIIKNTNDEEIRALWQPKLNEFKKIRKKYLIYKDF